MGNVLIVDAILMDSVPHARELVQIASRDPGRRTPILFRTRNGESITAQVALGD